MNEDTQPHQCLHKHIQSFKFEDGKPAPLWACAECLLKFVPAQAPAPLTDANIRHQWEATFSTNNPFCPCDLRSFTKASRAIERAHGIGAEVKP